MSAATEATNWVPAATAGIAALAALGSQVIAGQLQGRNQERGEQRQRRDRAAEVLAEYTALYHDASPSVVQESDDPAGALEALFERRDKARMALYMIATTHPSARAREVAGTVDFELITSLRAMKAAVHGQGDAQEETWMMARGFHARFHDALSELIVVVREA
jgi:hypothetical protein